METQASNKTAHPGRVAKAPPHRTTDKVQEEQAAKAQTKAACTEAKKKSIKCAAEFECDDIANEDLICYSPHLPFTPKPQPPLHKCKANYTPKSDLNPIKESSDVEMADDCDLHSEGSVVGNSEVKSATVPSPAKKRKANARKGALLKVAATKKAIAKMAGKKAIVKMAGKKATVKTASKKKFEESDVETVDSEAELVKVPKPKKEKVWVQDDINIAAKAIEEKDSSGNKYANMLKSMVSNGGKADGQLAIKVLSLSQGIAVEEKKVQKEVSLLCKQGWL